MKRIIIFLAFFFKIIMPHIENGTFTFSDKLMAQGMGDESMCGLICSSSVFQIPCNLIGVTTCGDPITITPPMQTCPYCGSPYCHGECRTPLPPVDPNTYDICDSRNPYYNPCYCTSCGSTPLPPANPNPPTPPNPPNPSDPTPPPTPPPATKTPPRVNCGTTATNNAYTVSTIYSNPGWSYLPWQLAGMAESGYPNEQAMVLNKTSNGSDYSNGGLVQGGPSSVIGLNMTCETKYDGLGSPYKIGSIAVMHSHPRGGYPAPSTGDLYGLIESNALCGIFKDDFVLAFNQEKFVIHVEDASLVSTFVTSYPKATNYDPVTHGFLIGSPLGIEFDNAKLAFIAEGYTDHMAFELATAYVLNSKSSGIKLMKKDGEFFKEVRVSGALDTKGKMVYSVTWCL